MNIKASGSWVSTMINLFASDNPHTIVPLSLPTHTPTAPTFGIGSPMYTADEGTTLTVPINLVYGELDGVSLTVEVSCNNNTAICKCFALHVCMQSKFNNKHT